LSAVGPQTSSAAAAVMAPRTMPRKAAAPAATKRETQAAAAAPAAKKQKVDPACRGIIEAIEQATDLPEACRKMLLACIPKAFATPNGQRHETQSSMVAMVGEVINEVTSKLEEAAVAEREKVVDIEGRKTQLESALKDAEEQLVAATEEIGTKTAAFAEAATATDAAKAARQEKQEMQRTGDLAMVTSRVEKIALETVMSANLSVIIEGQSDDAAQHYNELLPFLQGGVDESLMSALPSSCGKKAAERGSFDTMVLEQIGTLFKDKLAALAKAVDEAAPAAEERAADVAAAQAALEAASSAQQAAADALNGAKGAEQDAAAAARAAKDALSAHEPEYASATTACDDKATVLENFKLYNVASFELLRDRAAVEASSVAVSGGA